MLEIETVFDATKTPAVRGFIHQPVGARRAAVVLTHGAGSNCNAPLLVALSEALAQAGVASLRCDLPYRQRHPHGPPRGTAAEDQAGLRRAVNILKEMVPGPIFMGGMSYGGRQATILAGSEPELVNGLMILSYPLHPPGKPDQLRIAHLSKIRMPALFISGAKDKFGSPEEMRAAIALIPANVSFVSIEGAGHDLGFGRGSRQHNTTEHIVQTFEELFLEV